MTARAAGRPLVAYFAHDARETTVQKRVAAMEEAGASVVGFTFRRPHAERSEVPFENVPLGRTVDRNYVARLPRLAAGAAVAARHGEVLRAARLVMARNLDMLAVALAARRIARARAPVAYEVLDVQRVMTGSGPLPASMRAAERSLLRGVDGLVVSSPDFVTRYFEPVHGWSGRWFLLENKIAAARLSAAPEAFRRRPALPPGPPWRIGWFGVLRCERSLSILGDLAGRLGPAVEIVLRGRLSIEDIAPARLARALAGRPNIRFDGPYLSPDDLADLYGAVHFAWAVDCTDAGSNSDWLLPNRLYEGGLFGAVAIARAGTAVGRTVEGRGLGRALAEPLDRSVAGFLEGLDAPAYRAMRAAVEAAPRESFVDETDTRDILAGLGCLSGTPQPVRRPRRLAEASR